MKHPERLRARGVIAILGCACGALATAAGPILTLDRTLPPRHPDVLEARDVAVLPFSGNGGDELTALIEGVVAAAQADGKPVYRVSDRSGFEKRYKEIERSQKGEVLHQQSLRLGKQIGAQAIYTGVTEKPDLNQSRYQGTQRVCTQRDTRNNAASIFGFNCKKWADQRVNCVKRVATYAFNAKLTMVESGRVLLADRFVSAIETDNCKNAQSDQVSDEQLMQAAREAALVNLRGAIAPSAMKMKVEMFPADSKIADRAMRGGYADGLAFAKEQRMDRACEIWNRITGVGEPPIQIVYALGVCKEAAGEFAAANALYDKADRMLSRPDKKISAALQRTKPGAAAN